MSDFIAKGKDSFHAKFVEPIETKMRAMTLNSEPCVIATEAQAFEWLDQFATDLLKEARRETMLGGLYANPEFVALSAIDRAWKSFMK